MKPKRDAKAQPELAEAAARKRAADFAVCDKCSHYAIAHVSRYGCVMPPTWPPGRRVRCGCGGTTTWEPERTAALTTKGELEMTGHDTVRLLAHHISGDEYIVEQCTVLDADGNVLGRRTLGIAGPVQGSDVPANYPEFGDWLADCVNLSSEDVDWFEAEDFAGRVTYPYGAR